MRTGEVIADLPDLDGDNGPIQLAVQMGDYQTVAAGLPLPTAPENWERATLPMGSTLVLLQDDVPLWGGYVTQRHRTHDDVLPLSLATIEAYLDGLYLEDETFSQVGQNDIVAALITKYVTDIPIRVQYVTAGVGMLRDRSYLNTDNKTLYGVLQDLAGVIGGIEWTIGLEHQSTPERYTFVLYVGDRLGTSAPDGLGPAATFEMPGPVTEFDLGEDFTAGNGANDVLAYSSGQGDEQPQSPHEVYTDPDRPRFEYRWTPSTSITEVDTLTSYAVGKLQQIQAGTKAITLSAVADYAPRLAVDWNIGDDIGYDLTAPSVPGGRTGIARAIGWQLSLTPTQIITPILDGGS